MASLDDEQLSGWVAAWADRYNAAHDNQLAEFWCAEHLTRRTMEILIAWKFLRMPHRPSRAKRALADETDQAIIDITGAARLCLDDDAALRVIQAVAGVGPALGSSALMVLDPTRWTVLDVRALASVRAIGYSSVPASAQGRATWGPYLDACRDIAVRTGASLRTVDRALFAANGQADMPVAV
jgi:hypothetical protein